MDRKTLIAAAQSVSSTGELGVLLQRLRIRQARRLRASVLSYRELATRMGCSHGIVGAYLSGQVLPPVERFDRLILELGASRTECGALATTRDRLDDERRVRSASWPLPRQLPAAVTPLIGRRSALAALGAKQRGHGNPVILTAPTGMGKTALAVHWAYQVMDDFPDGQLYADLSGSAAGRLPRDPADVLAGFLHSLGFPLDSLPPDLDGRARLYRSLLARRRVLVLLDDAGDAAQVRPLLPGSPTCQVLITSRAPLTGLLAVEGAELILLGPLSPQQSRNLLEARLGQGRTSADPAAMNAIVANCGGNPLALAMVAAHAAVRPDLALGDEGAGGDGRPVAAL